MGAASLRVPTQLPPRVLLALRIVVFGLCLAPAGLLLRDLFTGGLGVNPVETLLRELGDWGLRLLLVTLAITPLRWLTGAAWLIRLRRMLGLFAFSYVVLHLSVFVVFEHSLRLAGILDDIANRPYILVGFSAFLLLVPLAVTSTQGWMRRLGRRWKQLHWLVYPAAILGVAHFFLLIKANRWTEPLIYAGILATLLGYRLARRAGPLRRSLGAPALRS
ncbi:sulfite oxidase heme-binding subunit YedZ [Sediminicurvatus halobius]|uniref:Protein-methionine-sulfoxide reductase heme-binding subunit MsrQ n=1 Tax=Sediminicurvatus halobius TaxID=2182432 RepID=A0A2U2MVV3_9GAMM|nr:protein-methionine-sulfoxide reductase heme-binding subunit MsrQ [Spiribacter halobius]PWG60916.1 sulfoxide reductase heme-binding subunit YedZ [Spiribacter halobius]UEX78664.1 sulfoxide reductase heme-binding subunit YedZ [Spiribacter halobius]